MPAVPPGSAPSLDVPNLAVHALWWAWLPTLLWRWDTLSGAGRVGMLGLGLALLFWNYAVLHNHMHVPVARPRVARWVVSRTLGLACGFAYRGYFIHHFNHHRFNDGPGDWGRRRPGEGALRYCLRSTLTPWVWPFPLLGRVWRACRTPRRRAELVLDLLLVQGALLTLVLWRPALGLGYLAMLLAGQFAIYWLNLAVHLGTDAARRERLANTSHSRLYNLLCFNAGLHQAHHLRPQLPWRQLPALTRQLAARGGLAPELESPLSPLNPLWVAAVARGYPPGPCTGQTALKTT